MDGDEMTSAIHVPPPGGAAGGQVTNIEITHADDVIQALRGELDAKWRQFGTALRFESSLMNTIQSDNGKSVTDCMLDLVTKWVNNYEGSGDFPRTWQTVVVAVRKIKYRKLAKELEKAYAVSINGNRRASLTSDSPPLSTLQPARVLLLFAVIILCAVVVTGLPICLPPWPFTNIWQQQVCWEGMPWTWVTGMEESRLSTATPEQSLSTSSVAITTDLPQPTLTSTGEQARVAREAEEKTRRELEEYLKKPTFEERVVETHVYKSNFYKWEWVHSAKAVDVATGITAKAQNYESKGGAKEHARINLKAILLEKGIIRKD